LKEPVEKDLGFTLFIAGEVMRTPGGEFGEFIPARHGGVLHEGGGRGNLEFIAWVWVDFGNALPDSAEIAGTGLVWWSEAAHRPAREGALANTCVRNRGNVLQ